MNDMGIAKLVDSKFFKHEFIAISMIGIIISFIGGCKNTKSADEMVNSIKESLPVGTSFTEIESYLKKAGFEYRYDSSEKQFRAILRDVKKDMLVSTSISLIIEMDQNDKLKKLDVKLLYTGL